MVECYEPSGIGEGQPKNGIGVRLEGGVGGKDLKTSSFIDIAHSVWIISLSPYNCPPSFF